MTRQRLDTYSSSHFDRGAGRLKEIAWLCCQSLLFASNLPGSGWRRGLLRLFGATVGRGVVIRNRVRIKFPWRLSVGHHVWIGENVWIDNLAPVSLGDHTCVSQGAYFCTGNHDWSRETFDLREAPIHIGSHCWIGAAACLAPGSAMADGAVLTMASRLSGTAESDGVYDGVPARRVGTRPGCEPPLPADSTLETSR